MRKRKISNPLALAVLSALFERSMHPYEIASVLKDRGKEYSLRMNYGSVYTAVNALLRAGFIKAVATFREGRRPERTVYALTSSGQVELREWLSDILRTPNKQYSAFEFGLSLIPVLRAEEVIQLLRQRVESLDTWLAEVRAFVEQTQAAGRRRLSVIDAEFQETLLHAELCWVRGLIAEFEAGTLDDLEAWRRWHTGDRNQIFQPRQVPTVPPMP